MPELAGEGLANRGTVLAPQTAFLIGNICEDICEILNMGATCRQNLFRFCVHLGHIAQRVIPHSIFSAHASCFLPVAMGHPVSHFPVVIPPVLRTSLHFGTFQVKDAHSVNKPRVLCNLNLDF